MIEFEPFYRRFGFNKLTHFLSPVVIKADTFVFPFNSELHYLQMTEEPTPIKKTYPLLKSHDKIYSKTLIGYGFDDIEGKFIRKAFQPLKEINNLSKDKDIKYLLPTQYHITIPRRAVIVYNYTSCQIGIQYYKNLRQKLWKYNNLTRSIVLNTTKTLKTKNVFITFELPNKLLSRDKMDIFSKELTPQRIRAIDDYRFFNLLAFWRFITPKFKESSWLSQWKKEDRIRINLLLIKDNSVVIMNLGLLENIIKEYNDENTQISVEDIYQLFNLSLEDASMLSKTKLKSIDVRKQSLILINRLINKTNNEINVLGDMTDEQIRSQNQLILNHTDVNLSPDIDLDNIIEQEISYTDIEKEFKESSGTNLIDDEDEGDFDDDDLNDDSEYYFSNTDYKTFANLDSLYKDKDENNFSKLIKQIDTLREEGQINKSKETALKNIISDQYKKTYRIMGEDVSLENILDIDQDQNKIQIKDSPVTDIPSVFDKSYNYNKIKTLDKQYLDEFMVKDGVRVAYSLQNSGYIVEDYSVQETSSILDTTQLHTLKVKSMEGKNSTIRFYLPKIDDDGSFKMSGNTYRIRKQRFEIPIRKISSQRVALSSYYGKVFIDKAYKKTFNYGYWYLRQLYKNPEVENIVDGEVSYPDIKVNKLYGMISKAIKSFVYDGFLFVFDYNVRKFHLEDKVIRDIESNGIIVGKSNTDDNILLVMDNSDYKIYKINIKNNAKEYYLTLFDLIGTTDLSSGPIEFAGIKFNKDYVPIVVPLSYYMGLENLLKTIGNDYLIDRKDQESQIKKEAMSKDKLKSMVKIKFLDADLYYQRDFNVGDMIFGGLEGYSKIVRETSFDSWNNKSAFPVVYAYFQLSPSVQVELNVMENMFIDPMTLSLLKSLKEPETFKGLLLKACELLVDDHYKHPNDVSGQLIKGYERLNGMVYRALTRALVKTEIESIFSVSKISLDPYEIMKQIKDDSTTVNVDDLNPLATIKQGEDVSYLGIFGRDILTMIKKTRAIHPSEIGVISESVKDNGQVGVTAYLSANPNITNLRGEVKEVDASQVGWGNIFSTPGLLTQWGDKDDMKRLNY